MNKVHHSHPLYKFSTYLIAGLLTSGLFLFVMINKGIAPFGKASILTIDLGQQYIDFFAYYKHTLLNHPEQFLYSFQKGFGGEMIGLWGYYLLSPFNLILLLFTDENLADAVCLITYLKLLAMTLSCLYMIRQRFSLSSPISIVFSLAYTYMSYTVIYLLNIMWLDALILLPLISLGLYRLIKDGQAKLYLLSLTMLLIVNFYTAYMTCIFLAVYALYTIISLHPTLQLRQIGKKYCQFIKYSLISALFAAPVLLPIFKSLLQNKIAIQTTTDVNFSDIGYHLFEIFSKYFIGAYNGDEMASGSPNIYASMVVLIFASLYFTSTQFKWQDKLTAGLVLFTFYLGFHFKLIDKLWHGGSYPIWYYYRYAFLFSFFLIELAIKAFQSLKGKLTLKQALVCLLVGTVLTFSYYYWAHFQTSISFSYLTSRRLFYSLCTYILTITLLYITVNPLFHVWRQISLLILIVLELGLNASQIIGEMSYVDRAKFQDYTYTLNQAVAGLNSNESDFYRIHTTFQRTKNEAFSAQFNGLNHFSSTIEASTSKLYGYLGLPDGSGFINYTNGTLFTDDLFNLRYQISPSPDTLKYTADNQYALTTKATDLDSLAYDLIYQGQRYQIRENTQRLGLAIEVSPDLTSQPEPLSKHQPIANQELLLRLIDFDGDGTPYFQQQQLAEPLIQHLDIVDTGQGDYKTYQKKLEPGNLLMSATMTYTFTPTDDQPYYFTLPSQFSNENIGLKLNGKEFMFYSPFKQRQIVTAAYHNKGKTRSFELTFKKDSLQANSVQLYRFDQQRYEQMIQRRQQQLFIIDSFKHQQIKGHIQTSQANGYLLFTIPFDSDWTITDNGKSVVPIPVLNHTLMAIPIKAGTHQISLSYFPKLFWLGLLGTLIAILLLLASYYRKHRRI